MASTLVAEVTVYSMHRVLTDFGLGVMSITLVLLAVFLSCSLLGQEIERKTIFLIVSKPVSRATFLLGRFAGTMLTLGALLVIMSGVFFLQCVLYRAPITAAALEAIGMLGVELCVLAAIGF